MWMTIQQVARYLKISRETIYKMAQRGEIPASKLGSQWRFNQLNIDEWMKSNSNQTVRSVEKVSRP